MASLSPNVALPSSAVEVEAISAAKALEFSLDIGVLTAIFEGDSSLVINSLKDPAPSLKLSHWFYDGKILVESFNNISFSHVCREDNSVAHRLVRHVIHVTS